MPFPRSLKRCGRSTHKVELLHQKYADKIESAFVRVGIEKNTILYQKLYPINLLDTPKTVLMTISLLNSSVMCSFPSDDYFSILLGIDYENVLDLHYDQKSIDLRQALIAIGNDIRFFIMEYLLQKDELTVADLVKMLKIPATTILRHVELVYQARVILMTRKSGLRIFYQLNKELCRKAANLFNYKLEGNVNEPDSFGKENTLVDETEG